MEQSAKRLAMNAFLRRRVGDDSATPHPPVPLKPARLTFTPDPHVGHDLPHEHANARRDHDEEHDAHPWRDVAEHFARRVIHIGHSENKIICDRQRRAWIAMGAFSLVKAKHYACVPSDVSRKLPPTTTIFFCTPVCGLLQRVTRVPC